MSDLTDDKIAGDVASLQREREGYVRRNLPERVALVDAELARLGVPVRRDDPAVETADAPKRPRRRS